MVPFQTPSDNVKHVFLFIYPLTWDKVGFCGHLATDNLRYLPHLIDANKDDKTPASVISLDAMKAFDGLEWSYLWAVLETMGQGKRLIHMIKVLYAAPSVMILTDKICLLHFSITKLSRQGCSLSPGLFALSLEPLAQFIGQWQNIRPISIWGTPHHITLYADDVLIFMHKPSTSATHLLRVTEDFGTLSGF